MGKHKFLTYDKSNKTGGEGHSASKSKNFGGGHNKFKKRNNPNPHFNAKPQESTPWLKLKEAFLEQEKEIQENKKRSSENKAEKDTVLGERNKKYKKFLIEEKQKEETSWEDFSSEAPANREISKDQGTSKLNPGQLSERDKQQFKQAITKNTIRAKGTTFLNCISDLRFNGINRKKV